MPLFGSSPFEDLVAKATSEQNVTDDWSLIMEICDKVVNYEDGPKCCLQALSKRLYHKVPRVVVQSLILLDACVKNCGKKFHLELSARYFVDSIPKLLSKMHDAAALKFKQLIRKWSEEDFKNDPELGLIPSLYYKLKSEGVDFPSEQEEKVIKTTPIVMDPDAVGSQEEEEDIIKAIALSLKDSSEPSLQESNLSIMVPSTAPVDTAKVRALYDFEAVEDNELTIQAGEIIIVTDRSNNSWWRGTNHRGEGYFPANFIMENLDAPINEEKGQEDEETIPKRIDDEDEIVVINEDKIDRALDWLNGIDPTTTEIQDPEELVVLERYCYAMSPLIDEKLQEIDRRCTDLHALNEELVKAVQLFYEFNSRPSVSFSSGLPDVASQASISKSMSPKSQGYVAQQNYVPNPEVTTAHLQAHYIPIASQAIPQGGAMSQGAIHYQPFFAMVPPQGMDPRYQVILSPQSVQVSSPETGVMQPVTSPGEANKEVSKIGESQNSNVPLYHSVMMPSHFQTQNMHGGMAVSNYSSLPLHLPSAFVSSQSVNAFTPQYIAQVAMSDRSVYGIPHTQHPSNSNETTVTNTPNNGSENTVTSIPVEISQSIPASNA